MTNIEEYDLTVKRNLDIPNGIVTLRTGRVTNLKGPHNPLITYQTGDIVSTSAGCYISLVDNNMAPLSDMMSWCPPSSNVCDFPIVQNTPQTNPDNYRVVLCEISNMRGVTMTLLDFKNLMLKAGTQVQFIEFIGARVEMINFLTIRPTAVLVEYQLIGGGGGGGGGAGVSGTYSGTDQFGNPLPPITFTRQAGSGGQAGDVITGSFIPTNMNVNLVVGAGGSSGLAGNKGANFTIRNQTTVEAATGNTNPPGTDGQEGQDTVLSIGLSIIGTAIGGGGGRTSTLSQVSTPYGPLTSPGLSGGIKLGNNQPPGFGSPSITGDGPNNNLNRTFPGTSPRNNGTGFGNGGGGGGTNPAGSSNGQTGGDGAARFFIYYT